MFDPLMVMAATFSKSAFFTRSITPLFDQTCSVQERSDPEKGIASSAIRRSSVLFSRKKPVFSVSKISTAASYNCPNVVSTSAVWASRVYWISLRESVTGNSTCASTRSGRILTADVGLSAMLRR